MFLGRYERSVDDKGRVPIPADLRAALGNGAYLTRSFDTCLCIYPAARWQSLAQAVDDLPQTRYEARALARSLFGGAVPCEFDRQGRISIPAFLRDHATIRGDVIIVGVFSRIEIWAKDLWHQEQEKFDEQGAQLAEVLSISNS